MFGKPATKRPQTVTLPDGRAPARIAIVATMLMAAAMFGFTVVLASGKGGTWAFPAFLAAIAVMAIACFALLARTRR